jgi:hypothetical protein
MCFTVQLICLRIVSNDISRARCTLAKNKEASVPLVLHPILWLRFKNPKLIGPAVLLHTFSVSVLVSGETKDRNRIVAVKMRQDFGRGD